MLVRDASDHFPRVHRGLSVDGHEIIRRVADALETVHPVDGLRRRCAIRTGRDAVVPRRPREARPWHHAGVGVDGGDVRLVAELAEHAPFVRVRVGEHPKRLVGVAGEHHPVEPLDLAFLRRDGGPGPPADHPGDGRSEPDARAVRIDERAQPPHVFAGAAFHGPPRMLCSQAEEAVVVEETQQRHRRELQHPVGRCAPDGAAHRHQVQVEESVAVAALPDVIAEGHPGPARVVQRGHGLGVEAVDGEQQPVERGPEQVPPLREQVVEARSAELQPGRHVLHAEAHVGGLHRHFQLLEEAAEVRVGDAVEHHEPGVERDRSGPAGHVDRVGMAAGIVRLLEQRDVETPAQEVRGAEAGDAGADDGETRKRHGPDSVDRIRRTSTAVAPAEIVRTARRPGPRSAALREVFGAVVRLGRHGA